LFEWLDGTSLSKSRDDITIMIDRSEPDVFSSDASPMYGNKRSYDTVEVAKKALKNQKPERVQDATITSYDKKFMDQVIKFQS
jgi:hypothetical protein